MSRGVVLLQTKSVLRHPVRLLQLFDALRRRHPLVCVNVSSAGYDFAAVKPLLASLASELPEHEMATLRSELKKEYKGAAGAGQLAESLSTAVPNAISVFFNPAAGDSMADAAIRDILDKLSKSEKLLKAGAIAEPAPSASPRRADRAASVQDAMLAGNGGEEEASGGAVVQTTRV